MKNHEVLPMGNVNNGYPMYFTLKGSDGKKFTKRAKTHDDKPLFRENKPVNDNFVNGTSVITIVHNVPIAVGDSITISQVEHVINEIVEQCKPKGSHVLSAMFYRVNCSYTRFMGQTV